MEDFKPSFFVNVIIAESENTPQMDGQTQPSSFHWNPFEKLPLDKRTISPKISRDFHKY